MNEVTAILTVWKRDHLDEQINALLYQTHPPSQIWIYHCCLNVKPRFSICNQNEKINYQFNTNDIGYFGRFSLGLTMPAPYLFILDDDVIPSENWISHSLETLKKYNAIVSSSGRIIPRNDYTPEQMKSREHAKLFSVGDNNSALEYNFCSEDTFVDFGCQSWFLKTEWLHNFWALKPINLSTGEDIHLSASCLLKGQIKTICPAQNKLTACGNLKKYYGVDSLASWQQYDFIQKRESVFRYLIDKCGWQPLRWG